MTYNPTRSPEQTVQRKGDLAGSTGPATPGRAPTERERRGAPPIGSDADAARVVAEFFANNPKPPRHPLTPVQVREAMRLQEERDAAEAAKKSNDSK